MEILLWKTSARAMPADDEFGQPKSNGKPENKAAVVLAGNGRTDGNGRWIVNLKPMVAGFNVYGRPSFVAMPAEKNELRAVALSAMIDGYVVTVASWQLGGGVAPGVVFSWQCVVLSD